MMVKAKCVTRCWDSVNAIEYAPNGGPLPGGFYEIDRHGPLASMKLGSTYCFDFDRNAGVDDKPHDYTCKKCGATKDPKGKKFTLATLGTHTKVEHKDEPAEPVGDELDDEQAEALALRTCNICDPPKVLKTPYGLRLHNEKSHPFQSQPEKAAATMAA